MKIFAHRGASTQFAEHTRAAFAHALAIGADGIETDVQLSADGHLVCWHDATVDRTSSGNGPVRVYDLSDLQQLDVHSWKISTHSASSSWPLEYGSSRDQLVTLDQLTRMMIAVDREVELAVEMKVETAGDGVEDAVLEWLRRWDWDAATGRFRLNGALSKVSVSVMSFSPEALRHVASVVPPSRLCPLFDRRVRYAETAGLLGPSVRWLALAKRRSLRAWLGAGHIVRMWTVETERQLRVARRVGVQQVTVNDPEWALQSVG